MKNISEYTQEKLNMMSTPELKDLLTDIINQREGIPDYSVEASQLDDLYLKVDNTINARKIYYIEIERQGNTLGVIKVNAANDQEATLKALLALHSCDTISTITKEVACSRIEEGYINYIIDEDGGELSVEDLEEGGDN